MRNLLMLMAVLSLTAIAPAREIEYSYVALTSPGRIAGGQTYTFVFRVQNSSSDSECIADVALHFPDGFTKHPQTMGFTELEPGRPSWDMYVTNGTCWWVDNDGGLGEIYATEATDIWIDATVPHQIMGTTVFWELWGDGSGADPHHVCGCIELLVSPVTDVTWTSIKAVFR